MPITQRSLLSIKNLSVLVEESQILNNFSLSIKSGQLHAIMGPNGSGKSTLAYTLMGHPNYAVTNGSVTFARKKLLMLSPDKRAQAGLFLAFQQPYELPGVEVFTFLKSIYYAVHKKPIAVGEFYEMVIKNMELLGIDPSYMHRNVNEGFSGGEKKRLEMLQMLVLKPKLAILDEIDSGLDVDGINNVINALRVVREQNPNMSLLVITHYQKLLEALRPDCVHVLENGAIKISGGYEVAENVYTKGYGGTKKSQSAPAG